MFSISAPQRIGGQDMASKKANIVIGMPCGDSNIRAKTAYSLVHAVNRKRDFDINFCMEIAGDIIGNRIRSVRQAQKLKATHILFIDHDMYFAPDTIQKLLDDDKDIVGAQYNFRSLPKKSTAFPVDEENDQGLYKCHAIGTGMLLVRMEVFEKLGEPFNWFQFGRGAEGEMVRGEDAHFCQQAIKAGYDVWADDTLEVKHLGEFAY